MTEPAAPHPRPALQARLSHRTWRDAGLLGVFCFCIYCLFLRHIVLWQNGRWHWDATQGSNELAHFETVRALVEGHTFAVDRFLLPAPADLSIYDGHLYSNKPLGFPLLVAPVYAACLYFWPWLSTATLPNLLPLFSAVMGGLTVALTYLLAHELHLSRQSAAFCALLTGLGTIVFVYATCFMSHTTSAVFVLLALWSAFRAQASDATGLFILAAFCIGYAVLLSPENGATLAPLCGYLIWTVLQTRRRSHFIWRISAMAIAAGIPLLIWAGYNQTCFGAFWRTAYTYVPPTAITRESGQRLYTLAEVLPGLWGLLFGTAKGIFAYTPVLLCALPGGYWALNDARYRHCRREISIVIATLCIAILIFAPYRYWFGGHLIGARHILPAIPLVAVLMGPCWEHMATRGRQLMIAAAFPSIIVHGMLAVLQRDTRALALSWLKEAGDQMGHLYTDILPLFATTTVDIGGSGLFYALKLTLCGLSVGLALGIAARFICHSPQKS